MSDNEPVVSPQMVSCIKIYTTKCINIRVLMTMKWLHQRFQCWVVGIKKLLRWSVLNINITFKKSIRKLEKLTYQFAGGRNSSFQSSVLEELNTVARQVGRTPDVTDHISEVVLEGTTYLEHSDCLKFHDSTCSWQQYYPVLSFLMTGNLHSD